MNDHPKGTGFWAAVVLCGIVAMPVLYLLLLGPMGLLCDTGCIPDGMYYAVWRPFVIVERDLPEIVSRSMGSYEDWWRSSFERVQMALNSDDATEGNKP